MDCTGSYLQQVLDIVHLHTIWRVHWMASMIVTTFQSSVAVDVWIACTKNNAAAWVLLSAGIPIEFITIADISNLWPQYQLNAVPASDVENIMEHCKTLLSTAMGHNNCKSQNTPSSYRLLYYMQQLMLLRHSICGPAENVWQLWLWVTWFKISLTTHKNEEFLWNHFSNRRFKHQERLADKIWCFIPFRVILEVWCIFISAVGKK